MAHRITRADAGKPADLLRGSIDHLGAAEVLFDGSPSHFDAAAYIAHLSMELLLKAWLLYARESFPKIHELAPLHRELVESCGALPLSHEQKAVLALLDRYSELRYPNRHNPTEVGSEDVQRIRDLAQSIADQLPAGLVIELAQMNPLEKGGRVLMRKKIEEARGPPDRSGH